MDFQKLFLKSTYTSVLFIIINTKVKNLLIVDSSCLDGKTHPPGQAELLQGWCCQEASELLALKMVTEVIIIYKRQSRGTTEILSSSNFLPKLILLEGHQY